MVAINKRSVYACIGVIIIILLISCDQNPKTEETTEDAMTANVAAEILRACKYPGGEFCEERCCRIDEECVESSFAFRECNLKTGEWKDKTYSDSDCGSACEIFAGEKANNVIEQEKPSCMEGWKCIDRFQRSYRLSNCSFTSVEYCERGCVNDVCANLCATGTFSCRNGILRVCDERGNNWKESITCEYGCKDGKCLNQTTQSNQISHSPVEVIDGDTIKLGSGETVRLIGINAPEKGQPYYSESSNRLKELIDNKKIILEADVGDKDRYDRLLRYMLADNENINIKLVKEGYATVYIVEPNKKYKTELENAWNECVNNKINLCKPPESAPNVCDSSCIKVFELHYKAGDDCKNLNGEYVIFQNNCEFSCDLKDWTVKDESSRTPYSFPALTLNKNDKATLYTGCGGDTNSNFYWCSKGYPCNAIWNNDKDTLYLRNSKGELILTYSYP